LPVTCGNPRVFSWALPRNLGEKPEKPQILEKHISAKKHMFLAKKPHFFVGKSTIFA
jgi:hypothetical protein